MKKIMLLHFIFISSVCFSQTCEFKNSILIFREKNSTDSALLKDNFYFFIDSSFYFSFIDFPFRENQFFTDFDFNQYDSVRKSAKEIQRYEPPSSISSLFKFSKEKNSIFLLFKDGKVQKKEEYFNLNGTACRLEVGFTGQINNFTSGIVQHYSKFLGIEKVYSRNQGIKCYKVIEFYCGKNNNSTQIVYLSVNNLIPMKIERFIYKTCPDSVSSGPLISSSIYCLFGVLNIEPSQLKGLHIWGREKF